MISSRIIKVETYFENIYRISTENGLILDIFESEAPDETTFIEYSVVINEKINDLHKTIMNGTVFHTQNNCINVSFGGLLGNIPYNNFPKDQTTVTLIYELLKQG